MQAIEFITTAEDGTIKIPKQYLNNLKNEIRVIILIEETKKTSQKKKLKSISIKTKNLAFDRNEANER